MALTRISDATVKRLLAGALATALGAEFRLKSEPRAEHPDNTESERWFTWRDLALTPQPRIPRDGEPDIATLVLNIAVETTGLRTQTDGDDAIDEAVDTLRAAIDQIPALIDGATRIELRRTNKTEPPSGENPAESAALVTVTGTVIRTAA